MFEVLLLQDSGCLLDMQSCGGKFCLWMSCLCSQVHSEYWIFCDKIKYNLLSTECLAFVSSLETCFSMYYYECFPLAKHHCLITSLHTEFNIKVILQKKLQKAAISSIMVRLRNNLFVASILAQQTQILAFFFFLIRTSLSVVSEVTFSPSKHAPSLQIILCGKH